MYNPNHYNSFKLYCKALYDNTRPAHYMLENPFLMYYHLLMKELKLSYSDIKQMNFAEFLELVHFIMNMKRIDTLNREKEE